MKTYFPALTGIRAVAAFLVFFFHFNPFLWKGHPASSDLTQLLGAIIGQGAMGVSIFFILSGFLIATRYMDRIEPSAAWAKQYMLNRFARIYPIYFLLTLVAFGAMFLGHLNTWYTWSSQTSAVDKVVSIAANLTLTRAFFHTFSELGMPTAWSLTVEECFYISAPFLLLLLRKRVSLLPLAALALLAMGAVSSLIATRLHLYGNFMQPLSFVLSHTYFGRCGEFLAGIGLAFWLQQRGNAPARRGTTLLGAGLIAVCLVAMVVSSWNYQPSEAWPTPLLNNLINNFLLPAGVVVLFHGLIHERTWFQQLLETKIFDLLGKSSYAFYLIHLGLFSDLLENIIGRNVLGLFLIFNIAAILLYKLVEHPLHTRIVAAYKRKTTAKAQLMPEKQAAKV